MAQPHKRHLRNYLLDRQYQLRYTAIMVLISSLLTTGLGYFWYDQMRTTSNSIEARALSSVSDEDAQHYYNELASGDRLRLMVLIGFGVLLAFAVAGYGIVLTHKVAGPLFKIARYMGDVRDGRLGPIYDLRKGDQLHEFYECFKQMHSALRKQAEHDISVLDEVIASTERHLAQAEPVRSQSVGELARYLEVLRELRGRKAASLSETADHPSRAA